MSVTAAQVKQLRERTGAGMMECKRALEAADGDIDAAAETMRKEGLAKADRKAGRVAAEGLIAIAVAADNSAAALVEVNCETDFVAKNDELVALADALARAVLEAKPGDGKDLGELQIEGVSVEQRRRELVAKLGENIEVRRHALVQAGEGGQVASYSHGGLIGTAVALQGGDADLARDIAMHVAASAPEYVSPDYVPEAVRAKEKEILAAQAEDSGKPPEIVDKMVEGRLNKYLAELALTGQPFVKDTDITVGELLSKHDASVTDFARLEVGEGIEKEEEDFAAEVQAQAAASQNG